MPAALTAHVVYTSVDKDRPATASPVAVEEIVRKALRFKGLLMTDDLSMHALSGTLKERAAAAFSAGCDIALHCNGDLSEMQQVCAATPVLDGQAKHRAEAALDRIRHEPEPLDEAWARAQLEAAFNLLA